MKIKIHRDIHNSFTTIKKNNFKIIVLSIQGINKLKNLYPSTFIKMKTIKI